MFFVQKWPFYQLFVIGNIGQENVFYDVLHRKNAFVAYKNKKFKESKNSHFSKEINPQFWYKIGHICIFFFRQYRPGKYLLRDYRTKKRLSFLKKQETQKVEKLTFFQSGSPLVLVQKWPFSHLFFKAIQARKMSFTIFQKKKKPFQAIKTRSSKSRKIDIFPKWLTHGFGFKKAPFPTFFSRQYRPGKCLLRYSRTKKLLSRL